MSDRFVHLFVSALIDDPGGLAQGDAESAAGGLTERWSELFNEGDYGALANLYTEDAVFSNGAGLFEGRAAIREHFASTATGEGSAIRITSDEVINFDDAVYAMGTYVVTAPDGSTTLMQGAWMSIAKLVDGERKIHRHLSNIWLTESEADPS
jgi:ketosteroid isomerase-like protein